MKKTLENGLELVTFYVNPLHFLYERDLRFEKQRYENGRAMDYPCACFEMRTGLLAAGRAKTKTDNPFYLKKQKILDDCFRGCFLGSFDKPLPILGITFFLSLNLAVNQTLRNRFYSHYTGKIPAITQFLLDHLRLGQLSDHRRLHEIKLNPLYESGDLECSVKLPTFLYIKNIINDSYEFSLVLEWFQLLEQHLADNQFWFKHFVFLRKTPYVSLKPLSITSFAKGYGENLAKLESSPLIEVYKLVNQSLDCRVLNSQIVSQGVVEYPEVDQLSDYVNNVYDQQHLKNEDKLSTALIDFVAGCKPSDLEAET